MKKNQTQQPSTSNTRESNNQEVQVCQRTVRQTS